MRRVLCAYVVVLTAFLLAAGWNGSAQAANTPDAAKSATSQGDKATESGATAEAVDVDVSLGTYQKQINLYAYTPKETKSVNGMFMVAMVTILNKGSTPCQLKPEMLVIRDETGKAYPLHKDFSSGFFEKPIPAGEKIKAKTIFDIPAKAESLTLRFEVNGKALAEFPLGDKSDDEFSRMFLSTPEQQQEAMKAAEAASAQKAQEKAARDAKLYGPGFPIDVAAGIFSASITAVTKGKSIQNDMNEWLESQTGTYVTVNLTLSNDGDKRADIPEGLFALRDKVQKSYAPLAPLSSSQFLSGSAPPQCESTGKLVFEVPLDAKGLSLVLKNAQDEAVAPFPEQ